MILKKIYLLLMLIIPVLVVAQEKLSYNTETDKIEFNISKEYYFVKFDSKQKSFLESKSEDEYYQIRDNYSIIKFSGGKSLNFSQRLIAVQERYEGKLIQIDPVLIYEDGTKQVCKGEIIIKFKNAENINQLFNDYLFEVEKDEFVENQFVVKIDGLNTFELFNYVDKLKNNVNIEFVEPNFIRLIKPLTNDTFFEYQWAINNRGHFLASVIGADMDVDNAWSYSTGSGVKVAIIDNGVDLDHPDLASNLLSGYDATDQDLDGAPNVSTNDAHGTACAGIVAAVANNGIGIAGIAYNAKIMPVRVAYSGSDGEWETHDSWIANAINWAVQNGADILSNSWGGGSPSSTVTNAINNAVNYGRNGKGCIVLFASGNDDKSSVIYPASLSSTIAVGASSFCDERCSTSSCDVENYWGSHYGDDIDIIAPGVHIYATDLSGASGYTSTDYVSWFRGTSAACPNAAGVAALVLSINPNFTETQVREILEKTTEKIGNYNYTKTYKRYNGTETWNEEVGFGRVNAHQAVQMAVNYDQMFSHFIIGETQLTPGYRASYRLSNPYAFATSYSWSIPSGCYINYCWDITQGQGTSSVIINAGSTGTYYITCRILRGSTTISNQTIRVNVQNPYTSGDGSGDDPCGEDPVMDDMVIYPPVPCDPEAMSVNSPYSNVFKLVTIYNVNGRKVLVSEEESVNISNLNNGIYIIKAEMQNGEILTKKIIK